MLLASWGVLAVEREHQLGLPGSILPIQARQTDASMQPKATTWQLDHTSGGWCPAGQRNAKKEECMAAVQQATMKEGLELDVTHGLKVVSNGAGGGVPSGCSYSHVSSNALFNDNEEGETTMIYQLVCIDIDLSGRLDVLPTKPNIILWLTDDQGWGNIGYHNDNVITPNMNALAKQGIILDRFYTAPWCAPSRSALMTGLMPHVGLQTVGRRLPKDMTFLPQVMKQSGYSTHHVGKWHLGMKHPWQYPTHRGFDTSFGYMDSQADYVTQRVDLEDMNIGWDCEGVDLQKDGEPAIGHNGTFSPVWFREELKRVMKIRSDTMPFFLYVALQAMHVPSPGPTVLDPYIQRYYGRGINDPPFVEANALITMADVQLGEMRTALHHANEWDKTLLIHMSDNGGAVVYQDMHHAQGTNWPLRGFKRTYFEGGVRVPAFVTGGAVPPAARGTKAEGLIHISDWFATVVEAAGGTLGYEDGELVRLEVGDQFMQTPPPRSLSMLRYLRGEEKASLRTSMILGAGETGDTVNGVEAIMEGDLKLINGTIPCSWDSWQGPAYPNTSNPHPYPDLPRNYRTCSLPTTTYLFNVKTDPEERINMADWKNMSDVKRELFQKLAAGRAQTPRVESEHDRALDKTMRLNACQAWVEAHGGFLGPYMTGIFEEDV